MGNLLGYFESTMDQKGRFLIPAALRKVMPASEKPSFVLNRGMGGCITLYTQEVWEPIFRKYSKLKDFDLRAKTFKRVFISGATAVEMDGNGRLLVPRHLVEFAGLSKDIILASDYDKVEIWDANRYKSQFLQISDSDFSELGAYVEDMLPPE